MSLIRGSYNTPPALSPLRGGIETLEDKIWFWGTNWDQFQECNRHDCIDSKLMDVTVSGIGECIDICHATDGCNLTLYRESLDSRLKTCRLGVTSWGQLDVKPVEAVNATGYALESTLKYTAIRLWKDVSPTSFGGVVNFEDQMWYWGANWNKFEECTDDCDFGHQLEDVDVAGIRECSDMCYFTEGCFLTLYRESDQEKTCRMGVTSWGNIHIEPIVAETYDGAYEVSPEFKYTAIKWGHQRICWDIYPYAKVKDSYCTERDAAEKTTLEDCQDQCLQMTSPKCIGVNYGRTPTAKKKCRFEVDCDIPNDQVLEHHLDNNNKVNRWNHWSHRICNEGDPCYRRYWKRKAKTHHNNRHGCNLHSYSKRSMDECRALCDQDNNCFGWSYQHRWWPSDVPYPDCIIANNCTDSEDPNLWEKDRNYDLFIKQKDCKKLADEYEWP